MEGGKQWFHYESNELHVLFKPLTAEKLWLGYLLVSSICATERGMSFFLDHHSFQKRILSLFTRSLLYGVVSSLRLLYMLAVMYFNTGLFLVVVFSLTMSQFVCEMVNYYRNTTKSPSMQYQGYKSIHEEEYRHQYNIPKIIVSSSSSSDISSNNKNEKV